MCLIHTTCLLLPDLPGEGTLRNFEAVLGRHAELGVQFGPDKVQVDGRSATHYLYNVENRLG